MKKFSPKDTPLSLYIHLPWCEKQCPYCDFNIDTNKKDGEEESLIEAILTDLDASKEYILDRKFISVYFGGGTPSLVKSKNVEKILLKLLNNRMLENDCEISFEFNPKEVSLDYVTDLSNMGYDVLLDDRKDGYGTKMKDSELIGVPLNIIIGKQYLENKEVELKSRSGESSVNNISEMETILNFFKNK